MEAIRMERVVPEDGVVKVTSPLLHAGDNVEVIVLRSAQKAKDTKFPLRGTSPFRYDDPFGPAAPVDDWEVLRDGP